MKNRTFTELIKSILGGFMISIGAVANLASGNRYVGAVLFTCGIAVILFFGMGLFTGRAGFLIDKGSCYIPTLVITFIGNAIGCLLLGLYAAERDFADVFTPRLSTPLFITFISAVLCGILVYAAVEGYRCSGSLVLSFICIPTFVIAGFEHCIADIFYLAAAGAYRTESYVFIAVVTLGNIIGCCTIPFCKKLTDC